MRVWFGLKSLFMFLFNAYTHILAFFITSSVVQAQLISQKIHFFKWFLGLLIQLDAVVAFISDYYIHSSLLGHRNKSILNGTFFLQKYSFTHTILKMIFENSRVVWMVLLLATCRFENLLNHILNWKSHNRFITSKYLLIISLLKHITCEQMLNVSVSNGIFQPMEMGLSNSRRKNCTWKWTDHLIRMDWRAQFVFFSPSTSGYKMADGEPKI